MAQASRKFLFGFISLLLVWAAMNSISYFVRSSGWGNLLGTNPDGIEAVGFPWVIWGEGGRFGGYYFSPAGLVGDVLITIASSIAVGLAAAWLYKKKLPAAESQVSPGDTEEASGQLQFSLRALLGTTAAVAFVMSMIQTSTESLAILLLAVYLFGPSVILVVAHVTRRIVPLQRNLVLLATGLLFILAAAVLGETIDGIGDFTRGILGIFVCWIPQCLLMLIVILGRRSMLSVRRGYQHGEQARRLNEY